MASFTLLNGAVAWSWFAARRWGGLLALLDQFDSGGVLWECLARSAAPLGFDPAVASSVSYLYHGCCRILRFLGARHFCCFE